MKKVLLSLVLLLTIAATSVAQAVKFGHFDSNAFMEQMPDVKEVQKTMDAEQSKIEKTITTLNEDFQKMYQEYQQKAAQMTNAEQMEKEQELQESYQKIQQYIQVSRQEIAQKQRELMTPIIQRVMRAVQEVGVENNFLYIIEEKAGAAVYVSSTKSTDITPLLKKKLGIK
mgnify:FL=1